MGIAHTVVALPYTLLIVVARLAGFDPQLEEAAMDLGASYPTTLRRMVLPIIAPAMVSAWLVAFTVSFDEFALALFLAGTEPTFPVYLFSQLRFANRLPVHDRPRGAADGRAPWGWCSSPSGSAGSARSRHRLAA